MRKDIASRNLEVIEDEAGGGLGKKFPKELETLWRKHLKMRLRICKYPADDFFALSDKKQTGVYNNLKDKVQELSWNVLDLERDRHIQKRKFNDAVKREALMLHESAGIVTAAEKRKQAYMKEANGMRVERQVVLLKLEAIYAEFKHIWDTTSFYLDSQAQRKRETDSKFKELIEMLRNDPERL